MLLEFKQRLASGTQREFALRGTSTGLAASTQTICEHRNRSPGGRSASIVVDRRCPRSDSYSRRPGHQCHSRFRNRMASWSGTRCAPPTTRKLRVHSGQVLKRDDLMPTIALPNDAECWAVSLKSVSNFSQILAQPAHFCWKSVDSIRHIGCSN